MSDEIRVNRPQTSARVMDAGMPSETMAHHPRSSKMPWLILAIVVVIIIVLGVLFRGQLMGGSGASMMASGSSGYQAVFLTNGQVYFGKISQTQGDYVTLKDIYYLQVIQRQPLQGTPANGGAAANPGQDITLVKLGSELHGPVDEMHISRPQILFYEDLKTDGQVVKAIQAYKANPSGATAPSPAPVQQAPAAAPTPTPTPAPAK